MQSDYRERLFNDAFVYALSDILVLKHTTRNFAYTYDILVSQSVSQFQEGLV